MSPETVLYAFFCQAEDGRKLSFQAQALPSDQHALQAAGRLLQVDPEYHQIAVWSGVRPVLTVTRPDPEPIPYEPQA